jgi:hypothetical protein
MSYRHATSRQERTSRRDAAVIVRSGAGRPRRPRSASGDQHPAGLLYSDDEFDPDPAAGSIYAVTDGNAHLDGDIHSRGRGATTTPA